MKKILLVLILLSALLTVGCSKLVKTSSQAEEKKNFDSYYDNLKEEISDESYDILSKIYNEYGIEVRFGEDSKIDDKNNMVALSPTNYDSSIKILYDALGFFGDNASTIKVIDDTIDLIKCYDAIIDDGEDYNSISSSSTKSVSLAFYGDFYSIDNKASSLASVMAWSISKKYDLNDIDFKSNSTNGFIAYDDKINNSSDKYFNILKSLYVDDYEQEMLKAGFLYDYSVDSIERDFNNYFISLFSNDNDFWDKYGQYPSIYNKANEVISLAESINPVWTLEYFVELSHPEGLKALTSIKNLEFDKTSDYIGEWEGTYENNTGQMILEIEIYEFNKDIGELKAIFNFSPGKNNDKGKSGSYYMKGNVNLKTGEILLYADEWISEKPKGYEMLHLKGTLIANNIIGELDREEMRDFSLIKIED